MKLVMELSWVGLWRIFNTVYWVLMESEGVESKNGQMAKEWMGFFFPP